MKKIPRVIDGIDVSHIQGASSAASAVRFKDGLPDKTGYRKYAVRLKGIDDYAVMREIVKRRYKRHTADLILIDGGPGQLSSAAKALEDIKRGLTVISIAKREEIVYKENNVPVRFRKDSNALRLLMYIRDEAHRFAVTYHRAMRSRKLLNGQ